MMITLEPAFVSNALPFPIFSPITPNTHFLSEDFASYLIDAILPRPLPKFHIKKLKKDQQTEGDEIEQTPARLSAGWAHMCMISTMVDVRPKWPIESSGCSWVG